MSEKNTVSVKIYGQEYSISGDTSREHIMKVADYVDGKMQEIASASKNLPVSSLAVLSALNIAEESFSKEDNTEELGLQVQKLEEEVERYQGLWEEAKKSLARHREEMNDANEQRDFIKRQYGEKEQQLDAVRGELEETKKYNEVLRNRVTELAGKLESFENAPAENQKHIEDLEARCRDIESSFFDLQMENINLKNQIEAYQRDTRF